MPTMSWLNSFDPAAPRSSSSASGSVPQNLVGSIRQQASQQSIQSSASVLSTAPSTSSRPAQTGRTTRLHQQAPHAGSSSSTRTARPSRPPHRIKAAPPSAALRSEDAQPNENQTRTKPWEIAAPPTIGKARSSQTTRPPRGSAGSSQRPPTGPKHSLPHRPPQQQSSAAPQIRAPTGPESLANSSQQPLSQGSYAAPPVGTPTGPRATVNTQPVNAQLAKNELKRMRREEHQRCIAAKAQRMAQAQQNQTQQKKGKKKKKKKPAQVTQPPTKRPTQSPEPTQPPTKKAKIEEVDEPARMEEVEEGEVPPSDEAEVSPSEAARIRALWDLSSSDSAMGRGQVSEDVRSPSPPLPPPSCPPPMPPCPPPLPASEPKSVAPAAVSSAPTSQKDDQSEAVGEHKQTSSPPLPASELESIGPAAVSTATASQNIDQREAPGEHRETGPPPLPASEPAPSAAPAVTSATVPVNDHQREASVEPKPPCPTLAQLRGIRAAVEQFSQPAVRPAQETQLAEPASAALRAKDFARHASDSSDVESVITPPASPSVLGAALKQASEVPAMPTMSSARAVKDEPRDEKLPGFGQTVLAPRATSSNKAEKQPVSDDEDDDDRPLAAALQASGRLAGLQSKAPQSLNDADSDPDEDTPLQDLLQRRSAEPTTTSTDRGSTWPSTPFQPKLKKAFAGANGMSIKYFVPIASAGLEGRDRTARSRATMFDSALAVSEAGRIVTYSEEPTYRYPGESLTVDLPSKFMHLQERPVDQKVKEAKVAGSIDRVEDVSRLTSKVCAIASSTTQPLGLGNHDSYPCQVTLVTVDSGSHRSYHLPERPHSYGVSSISHFPRTNPDDAGSLDFTTGGIDGVVHHWCWSKPHSSTARLHTLHAGRPVIALEHLTRTHLLASASIGTVVGFDLAALTLGWSWSTSDRIVHLTRTPDPRLMLGVLARRDYDQFRMFDVAGGNGPVSRPVISFGWLNGAEGRLPLGRGSFHPTRRAVYAHGAEDGHVRMWDMRNARDPMVDVRLGDEPIVEAIWATEGLEDLLYVATMRGVRSVSLLAP